MIPDPKKENKIKNIHVVIIVSVIVIFIVSFTGVGYLFYIIISNAAPTGPGVYHYYYVEIINNSTSEYQVNVPFPQFKEESLLNTRNKGYIDNLQRTKGDCSYKVISYNGMKYLQINGKSNSTISSYYEIYDYTDTLSLISEKGNETIIFSDSSVISIILEYRAWAVDVYNEPHIPDNSYLYSAVLDNDGQYPSITNETWGDRLSMEYALKLNQGKHSYPVIEGLERNPLSLVIGRASLTHPEENG